MKIYTVDLDLFKIVAAHAEKVEWRISSSGRGFHLRWTCPFDTCCICRSFQKSLDDPRRAELDAKRATRRRGVLYDLKGPNAAGPWVEVPKPQPEDTTRAITNRSPRPRRTTNQYRVRVRALPRPANIHGQVRFGDPTTD